MLENRSFPPAPILSQRSSRSRVRSRRARKRRALDRCGPLQPAPLRRKNKKQKTSTVFYRKIAHPDRLGTTISNSVDPLPPPFCAFSAPAHTRLPCPCGLPFSLHHLGKVQPWCQR